MGTLVVDVELLLLFVHLHDGILSLRLKGYCSIIIILVINQLEWFLLFYYMWKSSLKIINLNLLYTFNFYLDLRIINFIVALRISSYRLLNSIKNLKNKSPFIVIYNLLLYYQPKLVWNSSHQSHKMKIQILLISIFAFIKLITSNDLQNIANQPVAKC